MKASTSTTVSAKTRRSARESRVEERARTPSIRSFGEHYRQVAVPALQEKLHRENVLSLPRVDHVLVAAGVGKHGKEGKFLEQVEEGLTLLTGQKPVRTLARKSIAGFKVRQGQAVGLKVTLRGKRMKDFLQRLISVTLPRVRDFRGIPIQSIDASGNLTIGIREAQAFPEVDPQKVETLFGLQVTIVTTAHSREEARLLFESLGFPMTEVALERVSAIGPQKKA
jgi:large subunit ribosomal protein L5